MRDTVDENQFIDLKISNLKRKIEINLKEKYILIDFLESPEKDYLLLISFIYEYLGTGIKSERIIIKNNKHYIKFSISYCNFLFNNLPVLNQFSLKHKLKLFKEALNLILVLYILNENFSNFDLKLFFIDYDEITKDLKLKYLYYRKFFN